MAEMCEQPRLITTPGEITLIERVFLRIGSAETDEQLEHAVRKFLPPVLLKLSSQQEGVRTKVMELLVHINKRIKNRHSIQLPVQALLLQYQDPAATSFIINFTIIYIKMGFPRMEASQQAELVPSLINCLEGKPQLHQDSLLRLLVCALPYLHFSPDPAKCCAQFQLAERPHLAQMLMEYFLDVLLLPYGAPPPMPSSSSSSGAGSSSSSVKPPAGMSETSYRRVTGETPLTAAELEKAKLGIVKFLSCGIIAEEDTLPHLIVAAADPHYAVASAADAQIKKTIGGMDMNSTLLVDKLYWIFLGSASIKEKHLIKEGQKRTSASPRIQLKILPYLLKSREAGSRLPGCIQVVFDGLFSGNSNTKLKHLAMQFAHHIIMSCPEQKLSPVGGVLLTALLKVIKENKEDSSLRGFAYIGVGKLGNKFPRLVTDGLVLLQNFFEAITQEEGDTRLAVMEALSLMAPAFRNVEDSTKQMMEVLLTHSIEQPEPHVRQLAVQYVACVFPPDHVPTRYLLLLAAGDSNEEVLAIAIKALFMKGDDWKNKKAEMKYPEFSEMVTYLAEKANQRMKSSSQRYTTGNKHLPFNPITFTEVLTYLRLCLAHSAGAIITGQHQPSPAEHQYSLISTYLQKLLKSSECHQCVHSYLSLTEQYLGAIGGVIPLNCLLEIVAMVPRQIVKSFVSKRQWLQRFVCSAREDMRDVAGQLMGIILADGLPKNEFETAIKSYIEGCTNKVLEEKHGILVTLGYALSRRMLAGAQSTTPTYWEQAVQVPIDSLKDKHPVILSGACLSLGEMGRLGAVRFDDKTRATQIISDLQAVMKNSNLPSNVRERAALASGLLCVGNKQFPRRQVMEGFLKLSKEIKELEIHLTMGDALVYCCEGEASPIRRDQWTQSEASWDMSKIDHSWEQLEWLIDQLLQDYVVQSKPSVKQASALWLLTLLKKCQKVEAVQSRLSLIQGAFMDLLADSNELVQDTAGKGISLVYETCDTEARAQLVEQLLETLMTGKRRKGESVTPDTKLFENEELGKSPTGGNLNTYKELCSLASDLNQPELIYKFMHLANHHSLWNSKKGAAFGFTHIAEVAGAQLSAHLPKIVPKLYRYQWDPNPRIQQSMQSIWHALVSDSQKTVDKYFDSILKELLVSLTDTHWRVRESSCVAITELVRGRSLHENKAELGELWKTLFRVLDDIKESVRKAAHAALKALSKTCVTSCSTPGNKAAIAVMEVVCPVLMDAALHSSVSEVSLHALDTLVELVSVAGELIRPHVASLIPALLEALSIREPQELNYLATRLEGRSGKEARQLDQARIDSVKTSPYMRTIQKILVHVNENNIELLCAKLVEILRGGLGLRTRGGATMVVVHLVRHNSQALQPHTGKLLAALVHGLHDRNVTIRHCHATAIGEIAKCCKDSSIEKLGAKLCTLYKEKDEDLKLAVALVLRGLVRNSPDTLSVHGKVTVPLAFFGMHAKKPEDSEDDDSEWSGSVLEEVWQECTPGSDFGIQNNVVGILALLKETLESQSWDTRATSARAIKTVAEKVGSKLDAESCGSLLSVLKNALSGRTWPGKGNLLLALAAVAVNCQQTLLQSADCDISTSTVLDLLLKECRKESVGYKTTALVATSQVISSLDGDKFSSFMDILRPILSPNKESDDSDEEKSKDDVWKLYETGLETLAVSWPKKNELQKHHLGPVIDVLAKSLSTSPRKSQITVVKGLEKVVTTVEPELLDEAQVKVMAEVIEQALKITKYTSLTETALATSVALLTKLKGRKALVELCNKHLGKTIESLTEHFQPSVKQRAKDVKNLLQL